MDPETSKRERNALLFEEVKEAVHRFQPKEGPSSIDPNTSLYKQEPYGQVLSKLQEKHSDLSETQLKRLMGFSAINLSKEDQVTPHPNTYEIRQLAQSAREHMRSRTAEGKNIFTTDTIHKVFSDIITDLKEYPLWAKYICSRVQLGSTYTYEGDFNPQRAQKDASTESYIAFYNRELPQMARDYYIGLDESKPDAYTREPHAPQGKGGVNTSWQKREAAEVIRKGWKKDTKK